MLLSKYIKVISKYALAIAVLSIAGLQKMAKADTYTLISTTDTTGTFTAETAIYKATQDNDNHHFVGDFTLQQYVHGSTSTGPSWSSPFASLTSPPESQTVHYDMWVNIPTNGYSAWISLLEGTEDGKEDWRHQYVVGGLPQSEVLERVRLWYSKGGDPTSHITP